MIEPHPDHAFFLLVLSVTLVATLLSLARTLPAQNVIAVASIILLLSSLSQTIGAQTGPPFGHFFYTNDLPSGFPLIAWPAPLVWVVMILNSRGVARLILRPWRQLSHYGFCSLALTCGFTLMFDLALGPYAGSANPAWSGQNPQSISSWYGTPWINLISAAAATLLILIAATPWLINKKPVATSTPDYFPLIIWSLLMLLLTFGNAIHQFRAAAFFSFVLATIIPASAWRNSRRSNSD